jgi:hypothetical protein
LLSTKRKLKLLKDGRHVRRLIIVSFFLQNCHTCLNNGNCVTSMFSANAPSLEEYLPLEEDMVPMIEGDDEVSLGYTYDYGGKCVKYNKNEEIEIDIQPGSLVYNDMNTNNI